MASVIVAGATGAIGRSVVQHAIRQPSIQRVVALTRAANVTEANYAQLFGVGTQNHAAGGDANSEREHLGSSSEVVMVTPQEAAKIQPVTMDWEAFTNAWSTTSAAADSAAATDALHTYKDIFAGHTYAAMCLGTTRKDAGSAAQFTRCDYDYVMAFTEAVLTYSAPAGLGPAAAFIHHVNDAGEVKKGAVSAQAAATAPTAPPPPSSTSSASAKSTGTLRAFCQISAAGADSNSWFLYMRTKGNADEATVERIHQHNKTAAAAAAPILLFLLRPGLLNRHGKSRWNEKLAKAILPSMPVETCGAAAVSCFVEPEIRQAITATAPLSASAQATLDAQSQEMARRGESTILLGNPFKTTTTMKKAGVPSEEDFAYVYELTNSTIKHLAGRLTEENKAEATTAGEP
ncbi:hypothetical protein ABB37_08312 [Leptomonas pyrrhocoris]|uniref:Uncharacterized protein n=1 Tax=Leptomonas pyrrhocoris TaxID=157538 RepID=A0A0M9FTJ8_LEPPY|nr:hypothetical protein ABB37_08312 [Leptomonas pyrrhocoris]KPA75785.1 hypothetical protein ABB37_08312 [Leptomonas pyrrhocoris]|eukprot:XP_015654224.1 hypothetical protein ABB37_08312 [Leptomonas pyrrhocoris]